MLVALVVWIGQRPGFVRVEWLDYTFTVHVGLFLLCALGVILTAIFVYNIITAFVKFPSSYRRYREVRNQEKGYEALTIGLTAVAAGDAKEAVKQAARAEKFLEDDTGLPLLLKAQSARLDGRESDALKNFAALLEDKNAAFLGVRGLLQAAMDREDYEKALELATHAFTLHSRQPWIARLVYDLHVRLRHWNRALDMLYRVEKLKAMSVEDARADRVAIMTAQADEETEAKDAQGILQQAVKIDPAFVPAVTRLARLYLGAGKRSKAVSLVKKAWVKNPHPALEGVWALLLSPKKAGQPMARMRWAEELLKVREDAAAGQLAAGRIAMDEKLWGEARAHLLRAEELEPAQSVYEALADLEERSGQGQAAVKAWQEQARNAAPDYAWMCAQTGRLYREWMVIAPPHDAFNTIEWMQPQTYAALGAPADLAANDVTAVLDTPKEI